MYVCIHIYIHIYIYICRYVYIYMYNGRYFQVWFIMVLYLNVLYNWCNVMHANLMEQNACTWTYDAFYRYVHMDVHKYGCIHPFMPVYIGRDIDVHYIYTVCNVCMYIYIYIYMYVCTYIYIHIYIGLYIHICIYDHICIYIPYRFTYSYIHIYIFHLISLYLQGSGPAAPRCPRRRLVRPTWKPPAVPTAWRLKPRCFRRRPSGCRVLMVFLGTRKEWTKNYQHIFPLMSCIYIYIYIYVYLLVSCTVYCCNQPETLFSRCVGPQATNF